MSNEETANPRDPDESEQSAATAVAPCDPAEARRHLAASCEELAAARRRWEALEEAAPVSYTAPMVQAQMPRLGDDEP